MNKPSAIAIALALTLGAAGSTLAQGNSHHQRFDNGNSNCQNGPGNCAGPDQRQRPGPGQRPGPDENMRRPMPPAYQQGHMDPRNGQQRPYNGAQRDERGAGPNHSYYRGGHLPPQYRTRQYVVEDWRGHHLSAPPRGYHWVQNGGDYLLVAISTGIILQLLLNN